MGHRVGDFRGEVETVVSIGEDLREEVAAIFADPWDESDGIVVPTDQTVTFANTGVNINGAVLYADMADSTHLVAGYDKTFAAEIYKTFLRCATRLIQSEKGTVTAYDGDRVMAVYLGTAKNTSAVRTALKINYAVGQIIAPAIKTQYPNLGYVPKHVCGIDTSELFVAKTGVRGTNDLVWVGRAANYAAKLSAFDHDWPTWITEDVFDVLHASMKLPNMWEQRFWTAMNNKRVYRSTFHQEFS